MRGVASLVWCASRVAELFVLALGLRCRGSYGKPERRTQAWIESEVTLESLPLCLSQAYTALGIRGEMRVGPRER